MTVVLFNDRNGNFSNQGLKCRVTIDLSESIMPPINLLKGWTAKACGEKYRLDIEILFKIVLVSIVFGHFS